MKKVYIESLPTKMSQGRHYIPKQKNDESDSDNLMTLFLEKTLEDDFLGFDQSIELPFEPG